MKTAIIGLCTISFMFFGGGDNSESVNSEKFIVEETTSQNIIKEDEDLIDINIVIGDNDFTAKLFKNESTQALINKMPLEIIMEELNGNEKFYYFDDPLPTAPQSIDKIQIGDLMLYGDDCLVLFYKSFPTNYKYTRLGYVENPDGFVDSLKESTVNVTFN